MVPTIWSFKQFTKTTIYNKKISKIPNNQIAFYGFTKNHTTKNSQTFLKRICKGS